MKSIIKFLLATKTMVIVTEIVNAIFGLGFIAVGIAFAIKLEKSFFLICFASIINIAFGIFLFNYYRVVKKCIWEMGIVNKQLPELDANVEMEENRQELEQMKNKKKTFKSMKPVNPFNAGDTVKTKFNLHSDVNNVTISAGTAGKVVGVLDDSIQVMFKVNGKNVMILENMSYFKNIS